MAKTKSIVNVLMSLVWMATVLVWPVLRWIVSIEVFFQFLRMMYYWNVPAGLTFVWHFAALTGLTYFVANKPKGIP